MAWRRAALTLAIASAIAQFAAVANAGWACLNATGQASLDDCTASLNDPAVTGPARILALRYRAAANLSLNRYWNALSDIDEIFAANAESAEDWWQRGLAQSGLGKDTEALRHFETANRLFGTDPVMMADLAFMQAKLGHHGEAAVTFSKLLERYPEHPPYLAERGWAYYQTNRYELALRDYDAALAKDKTLSRYWNERGIVHDALGDYAKAQSDYDAAARLAPADPIILANRGRLKITLGRYDDAIADLDQAIGLGAKDIDTMLSRARAHSFAEHWPQAIEDADSALRLEPKSTSALYWRAYARTGAGELDEAFADYSAALTLDSTSSEIYAGRADVLRKMERHEEAANDLTTALGLEPKNVDLQWKLGFAYENQGRFAESLAAYKKSIDLDPDYGWGYEGRAWALMGLRRLVEAMDDCETAIVKLPREPAAYRCRAQVRQEGNDSEGAKSDLRKALELDPTYAVGHYDLGRLCLGLAEYETARDAFTQTIELDYFTAQSLLFRGDAHRGLRDHRLALADYRRAAEIDPDGIGDIASRRIMALNARLPKIDREELDYPARHVADR